MIAQNEKEHVDDHTPFFNLEDWALLWVISLLRKSCIIEVKMTVLVISLLHHIASNS